MARRRQSQSPTKRTNVDTAIPDEFAEIIGDMADHPAYKEAWAHAARWGNGPKGCMVFAENHWQDFEDDAAEADQVVAPPDPATMSEDELDAEIKRLTEAKEAKAGSAKK